MGTGDVLMDRCKAFVSEMCVNGHCPDIPSEYDEREYSNGINCGECWHMTYRCEDCIFRDSDECPKTEKEVIYEHHTR